MVFSSFPVYLDHPNLHQHASGIENSHLPPPPPPPPQAVGGGSIRPGSMVDRARLAKLPLPEAGLKCPRCDSTNTKFCYFNNYSLTQPRHFCKTCRRYWTRGGALRNVPVGGGCRRNKRTKSSSNSKPAAVGSGGADRQNVSNSTNASPANSSCSTDINNHFSHQSTQLPLMASLPNLNNYGGGSSLASSIPGFQQMVGSNGDMGFHLGSSFGVSGNNILAGGAQEWRLPSLSGFEPSANLYSFQAGGIEASSSLMASVKMEENRGLNATKQMFGASQNNQYWGGNTWAAGFSDVNSSTTTHLL